MAMLRTAELDMTDTFSESDIADFLTNATWAVCSTYHTVLKTSPGAAIFGRDMLFNVPFLADWTKIGEYRQLQTDKNTAREKIPELTGTINPETKYCCAKMVSSANQRAGMKVILGQSHQFIQMVL